MGVLYEVSISFSPSRRLAEHVRTFLQAYVAPQEIVESAQGEMLTVSCYLSDRSRAEEIKRNAGCLSSGPVSIGLKALRNQDWELRWKEGIAPFLLTRTIRVVPLWLRKEAVQKRRAGCTDIFIDAGMAFGTGLHPTTRSMAEFIEGHRGRFGSFLDIGTGTGILSFIASSFGAKKICALDISHDSVAMARRLGRINRCRFDSLEVSDFRSSQGTEQFDFVAANLLAPILISARARIIRCVKPGKYLAVSGIWGADYPRFRKLFTSPRLTRVKVTREKQWVSVLYRKNGPA